MIFQQSRQTTTARILSRSLIAAAAMIVTSGLAVPIPASAHDQLLGSDPAADSQVAHLPAQLVLTFSAQISSEPGATIVQVTDAAGHSLTDGEPEVTDNTVTQPLQGNPAGEVTVQWKIVSSDGHPVAESFSFSVAAPGSSTPSPTVRVTTDAPAAAATGSAAPESPTAAPEQLSTAGTPAASPPTWIWAVIVGVLAAGALSTVVIARRRSRAASPSTHPDSATSTRH